MYVGNSVQGIREAGLQLYSVADGCFGSWGTAELCPCMAALQPTARQLWACTLQSDAVFVCLSELPKWSGRPWSTRLLTARWYSPSTGWRPCWSARDFWWVFLIGSLTAVSLHLISMQNTPSGYDDVFWIDEGHLGQLSNLPTGLNCSRHLFAISPDLSDTSAQTSWVMFWRSKKENFNQKESFVGHPAADPGALYFWLAQEIQKNLNISQSFTIANAESAALEQ